MDSIIQRVAARYKGKKVTDEGNTVYLYSERQIQNRNRKKAERLEKLSKNIHKLRAQVKKDLKSEDTATRMTALAVALIDHTYERVGNDESADEGHFGVTGWQKSHISFGKGKATIKYVGKSGVKQEKHVSDSDILPVLRKAYDECEDGLFSSEGCKVDATKVNSYLKDFDVTAKDLRGFHANREMKDNLKTVRKGTLPSDKKEREKKLKEEWKEALELTAKAVGHEPSTLKSQYLVPGLYEAYMKDGSIPEKMKIAESRVAARFLQAEQFSLSVDQVELWRKQLRNITKIYKSIGLEGDSRDLDMWDEAQTIFRKFRENFKKWVYQIVLPKVNSEKERTPLARDIAKKAWDFVYHFDSDTLFPSHWAGDGKKRTPDFASLRNNRDKNIAKYQRALNEALKDIASFIEWRPEEERTRHLDETHHIAGMTVIVEGYGRGEQEDDLDQWLRGLASLAGAISKAGFGDTTRGMKIVFKSHRDDDWDVNARYNPAEDQMTVTPMGIAGGTRSGHGTFIHEVGHRFWFRQVGSEGKAHWVDVVKDRTAEITQEDVDAFLVHVLKNEEKVLRFESADFQRWAENIADDALQGAKFRELARLPLYVIGAKFDRNDYRTRLTGLVGESVLIEDISEYAASGGPIEAFAEVFRIYVTKGPGALGPATLALFKDVCRASGAKLASESIVAARFMSR